MPVPQKIEIKQLDMELNGGCNYKCPMCPQATGREKDFLRKLPFDVFKNVVDDAMQYGLDTVSLHGSGEPTLNRDMPAFVCVNLRPSRTICAPESLLTAFEARCPIRSSGAAGFFTSFFPSIFTISGR